MLSTCNARLPTNIFVRHGKTGPSGETKMRASNEENLSAANNSDSSMTAKARGMKTVYLIRHAESNENRRRDSLTRCFEQISTGAIPSTEDLNASFELLNVPAQLNSDVSEIGAQQIRHMGNQLQDYNFLEKKGVQLVVHSPLIRARQTCEGLLGCVAGKSRKNLPTCVKRVEELECLIERQPQEIPQEVILKDVSPTSSSFTRRIKDFEQWLVAQPEDTIAVVGHSLHFKNMLNVSFKFKNCEVWVARFDPNQVPSPRAPLLILPPIPQSMKQINMNFFQKQKEESPREEEEEDKRVTPWSDLKRVYGCDFEALSAGTNNSLKDESPPMAGQK